MKKRKFKKAKVNKKNNWSLILFGLIGSSIFLILVLSIIFSYKTEKAKITSPILPPDYSQKAAIKPSGLEQVEELTPKKPAESLRLPIILYHYVEYVRDLGDFIRKRLDITPYTFEIQLKTLKENGYETYFVKEIPEILAGRINYNPKSVFLTFDDGYEDFYTVAFPLLKKHQMKATIYVIYNFIGRNGFMNEQEIKEILASGLVELGDHTFDHLSLPSIPEKEARYQIIDSKKKFEEKFGIEVKTIAYPYGAFDQQVINLVKEASYSAAVSVIPGVIQSDVDLYYLYRIRDGAFEGPDMVKVLESYKK